MRRKNVRISFSHPEIIDIEQLSRLYVIIDKMILDVDDFANENVHYLWHFISRGCVFRLRLSTHPFDS